MAANDLDEVVLQEPKDWREAFGKDLTAKLSTFTGSASALIERVEEAYDTIWRMARARTATPVQKAAAPRKAASKKAAK
eukprot:12835126-Alexandrium_andersonii.AAC.1